MSDMVVHASNPNTPGDNQADLLSLQPAICSSKVFPSVFALMEGSPGTQARNHTAVNHWYFSGRAS